MILQGLPLLASVPDWILDLLSVDTSRLEGGTQHFRFARFPEGGLGLLTLLAILAGFALIVWNYRREGQLATWKKLLLASFRCLVLLVAVLVLLYPVLEVDRQQELRATTLVLVDESLSQGIRDEYRSRTDLRDSTALALEMKPEEVVAATRAELVTKALSSESLGLLDGLAARNQLQVYGFAGLPLEPLRVEEVPHESAGNGSGDTPGPEAPDSRPPHLRVTEVDPTGTITDVAGALRSAVEEHGGVKLAGVVLFSDGRVTAGEDLQGVASLLGERTIPVHSVGVGDPTPTRNYRVTAVLASERVFTGDPVVVDVRLDQHGFDGETVSVELIDAYEPPGEPPRPPVKVASQEASFSGDRTDATTSFRFEPEGIGRHRLTARIVPREEESFVDDNERVVSVEVVKEASKVLLLAGGPTFEFRFLKNLLRRDSRISLASWLMSADVDFPQEGNISLEKLPTTAKELFEYDVVVLMDADPRGLPTDYPTLLEGFVGKHRGGLLFAASDKYAVSFFDNPALAPIRNMLPVLVDPGDVRDELERGRFFEREWPLVPTPAAMDHPATRLSSQIDRNRMVWAEIAGIYWAFPARKTKPGATVLFVHPDPALARDGTPRPVVATQYYEGGRVVWVGMDSTWRWRATAEEVYDRFWIQTIRYLTEGRLLGDRRRILQTDSESYELGETVRISVLLEDENYRPVEAEEVPVTVEAADGSTAELTLQRDPVSPGWFRGVYAPRRLGVHRFRIEEGDEKVINVEPPAIEFAEPRLDEKALRELSTLTGGSYVPLAEVASVPERIPDRRQMVVTTDEPIPLWDNWFSLGLLAGLLTIEWILRKLNRLL